MTLDLGELARSVVDRALQADATAAEAIAREGTEFSTVVRLGEVETLKQAGSRALGLRVFLNRRAASAYSSDLTEDGIGRLVASALDLVKISSEDPFAGLPEPAELGQLSEDLDLYHEDVSELSATERIGYARRAEAAALAFDPRITNSEGGSFDAGIGRKILTNSLGFFGQYRRSLCSVSVVPVAQQDGTMQRDFWSSVARALRKLQSPEQVGRIAAERTIRRLGARKTETKRVPLVFDPLTARALLEHVFEAVQGDAIYRSASFLAGKLGSDVASRSVTVIDDGTLPGGFGSAPFDGEGVPTRRTEVISRGQLNSYLLNTYTARKLGLKTTGNAARGLSGNPGIGCGNFYLSPGTRSPKEIIASVSDGLYVTDFLGFGVNLVTGDFSRGASGLWISNGELAYPVEEITVAGNLGQMLQNIGEIGNDLEFRGPVASPTLLIDGMVVAGR